MNHQNQFSAACTIRRASEYALSLLRTHTRGTIHSVYRKTVNLLLEEPGSAGTKPSSSQKSHTVLVALQAAASPLSPVSLITGLGAEQMASLPLAPGMAVSVCQDSILAASGCRFLLNVSHPARLLLDAALPEPELQLLERRIAEALSLRDAGSFELLFHAPERAAEIPFLAVAGKRLAEAAEALRSASRIKTAEAAQGGSPEHIPEAAQSGSPEYTSEAAQGGSPKHISEAAQGGSPVRTVKNPENRYFAEAASSLVRLVGLGLGLTPGGDDFLCGVLAGLILCGRRQHPFALLLADEIAAHLNDTNKISAAFLACSLENQFSQAVNELRLCHSAAKILRIFCEIGHSSGTDTLCGIYYAIQLRTLL